MGSGIPRIRATAKPPFTCGGCSTAHIPGRPAQMPHLARRHRARVHYRREMTRSDLLAVLRRYKLAVQASVHPDGRPQAAVVGYAVTEALEIVFDTVTTSRKYE